jgi:hypothetical protein
MNTKELKEYMNDIKSRMEEDYPNLEIKVHPAYVYLKNILLGIEIDVSGIENRNQTSDLISEIEYILSKDSDVLFDRSILHYRIGSYLPRGVYEWEWFKSLTREDEWKKISIILYLTNKIEKFENFKY